MQYLHKNTKMNEIAKARNRTIVFLIFNCFYDLVGWKRQPEREDSSINHIAFLKPDFGVMARTVTVITTCAQFAGLGTRTVTDTPKF